VLIQVRQLQLVRLHRPSVLFESKVVQLGRATAVHVLLQKRHCLVVALSKWVGWHAVQTGVVVMLAHVVQLAKVLHVIQVLLELSQKDVLHARQPQFDPAAYPNVLFTSICVHPDMTTEVQATQLVIMSYLKTQNMIIMIRAMF
jgi:hypothetical protein